jgi:hypothetical protein
MRGAQDSTVSAIAELERNNAQLLRMADNSAERHGSFVLLMQGLAPLYHALAEQARIERSRNALH